MPEWREVGKALLGSWPNQVAAWGHEALAAYLEELGGRGVTPSQALVAIRCCPAEQAFPPSAPELAAIARRDPSQPTFEEAYRLIYGPGGVFTGRPLQGRYDNEAAMLRARDDHAVQRAYGLHPLVGEFVARYGAGRLRMLALDDPEYGDLKRRELREAWGRHLEAMEGREVAVLASGGREGLQRFDPLAVLQAPRRELETGHESEVQ